MQPYSTITTDSIQHEQETSQGIFIKLFEEQVRANPNGDAVVFGNNCWSYDALDKISNKLSNFLRAEYQVGEGTLVGIIVERSDLTVISMLAVLKAGAAFVPVDPNSPAQRVSYLVRDTNMSVLLLQSSRMFDLQDIECPLFALDLQLD
ncbi:MAG: AMP-binding protein, partial [Bacteroidota bacterium]